MNVVFIGTNMDVAQQPAFVVQDIIKQPMVCPCYITHS